MPSTSLVRTRLSMGRYEGLLNASSPLDLEAVLDGRVIATAELRPNASEPNSHEVAIDLPAEVISDGIQVIGIRATGSTSFLDHVTLSAGNGYADDLREEVALLRAELDTLKRAFRSAISGDDGSN